METYLRPPAAQTRTTVEERIPFVHSLAVWKMCEAVGLKAKFVPLPGATVLPRTPHRGIDQKTTIPVVGSFSAWKICQALDLPAVYDPQIARTAVFRRPNKPVQIVHSTAILNCARLWTWRQNWILNKVYVYNAVMPYNILYVAPLKPYQQFIT
ncbi:hypothetical protein TNIN_297581 [Trichonephila inaurata madagascariensis]|uniref:Uncharacterized protein n=1 Tax=Trichonephila inaurata madagascariensis TaxID=2747483 RepID=A0A8X6XJ61_9ARAC|nr:hypothetical protein TNIN_297581 [Trichonephila inaurata madagascariensis]